MGWIQMIFVFLRSLLRSQGELAAENLALRQQLSILEHKSKRPRLRNRDRIFWAWLSRLWSNWRTVLVIVQPETVVRWHQLGFKLYWRWKSRAKRGRPSIEKEIRALIRRIGHENPLWGTRAFNLNSPWLDMLSPRQPSTSTEFALGSRRRKHGVRS
jgi:hypothetical protein